MGGQLGRGCGWRAAGWGSWRLVGCLLDWWRPRGSA